MSESEQKGRCWREVADAFGKPREQMSHDLVVAHWERMAIAGALDRLAADVAAVKEAVCDRAADPHAAWREVIIDRDLWIKHCSDAIRERDDATRRLVEATRQLDEARRDLDGAIRGNTRLTNDVAALRDRLRASVAEVERLQEELDDREQTEQVKRLREENEKLHRASLNYIHDRDQYRRERDEARAEVERLKAIVHSDAGHMAKILIENERLRAAPAAPQPAAPPPGWLTEEERRVLQNHAESLREQRFALERGGQTLGYSANPGSLKREADIIDAILARAGSPPVVEVPEEKIGCRHLLHRIYRAALDKAGVAWKEKPRE